MKRHPVFNSIVLGILAGFVTMLWGLAGVLLAVNAKDKADPLKADTTTVVAGNSEFALELYAKLNADPNIKETGGNLFFSPYSISTALAMTWAGARGQTEKQMAKVLHFSLAQDQLHPAFATLEKQLNAGGKKRGYQLSVANALWGQKGYGFLKDFIKLTKKNYGAGFREVDFVNPVQREKARKKINIWVEKKTKKKIKELIQPGILNKLTTLVLTNAIYFKGDWALEFDKKKTKDAPFMISADKQVNVPMMHLKDKFKYAETPDLQILELPYKKEALSMIVFLPTKIDGLEDLEKTLTLKNMNTWLAELRKQKVSVFLPKFKMTWGTFELKDILAEMGLPLFGDFTGISGDPKLFISNILHKAFVAVDEKGTEAAAATAVIMARGGVDYQPVFRADHPFVFMIKDNRSGSILFMGRVVNPSPGGEESAAKKTINDLVSEIVARANANDAEFFRELLDTPYKGQEQRLIEMVLRSGMASNYRERLQNKTPSEARLNYHYLEKGCSFQVDLAKQENNWSVKRIWFCK